MFLGLILGLVIPFILTSILHLLGFGTKGIVPGSIAAEWESSLHNVTKGTFFACKFSKTFPTLSKVWYFTGCQKTGMKGFGAGIISASSVFIGVFGLTIGSCVAKCKKIPAVPELSDVESGQVAPEPDVRIEEEQDDDLYHEENEPLELEHEEDTAPTAPLIQL